ncbi:MAG: type domain [Verrucomicrobiota bacterium]
MAAEAPRFLASSHQPGRDPALAMDGDRFTTDRAWAGEPGTNRWWWQAEFAEPRVVGAILQVHGDHGFVLRHAPTSDAWEGSDDGRAWRPMAGADQRSERRTFRLHRLERAERVRFVRLLVHEASGGFPVMREVEFHGPGAAVSFPEWVVAVNVTHDGALPGHGQEFIPLARETDARLQAQQVWLVNFDDDYLKAEPRPLAAFLSGSFKDWCEVDRAHWRGIQQVLRNRSVPLWASCGGAQGLALVSEHGVEQPWDCPHCRDPRRPLTPLYGHIGHVPGMHLACGRYGDCTFERGPMAIRKVGTDPAFEGLPDEFTVMESHCGQIEVVPRGVAMDCHERPQGPHADPVPSPPGRAGVRRAVPHRDGGHAGGVASHHGQFPGRSASVAGTDASEGGGPVSRGVGCRRVPARRRPRASGKTAQGSAFACSTITAPRWQLVGR